MNKEHELIFVDRNMHRAHYYNVKPKAYGITSGPRISDPLSYNKAQEFLYVFRCFIPEYGSYVLIK